MWREDNKKRAVWNMYCYSLTFNDKGRSFLMKKTPPLFYATVCSRQSYLTIPFESRTKLMILCISSLIGTWSSIFCRASCTLKLP